jgi:hypothetical protein
MPAKAGIHFENKNASVDSRFRGNDKLEHYLDLGVVAKIRTVAGTLRSGQSQERS